MITASQCRAARALLNWTLEDLARLSGLSRTSLNNFEQGTSNAKAETYRLMTQAFQTAGIEFLNNNGLRMQTPTGHILKGDNCHDALLDDIFETLKTGGGEVLVNSANERETYARYADKIIAHLKRLAQHHITERLLTAEGDSFFLQPMACYRWIPAIFYTASLPVFIYGNKVAIKSWHSDMVIVIANKDMADAERARFDAIWQQAKWPTA